MNAPQAAPVGQRRGKIASLSPPHGCMTRRVYVTPDCDMVTQFPTDSDSCELITRHGFDTPLTATAWQFSPLHRTASWEWCHHSARPTAALNLARRALRPSVASTQSRGFSFPCTHDEMRSASRHLT